MDEQVMPKMLTNACVQQQTTVLRGDSIHEALEDSLRHAFRQLVPDDLQAGVGKVGPQDVEIGQQTAAVLVRVS